jgi:hypothetical protein
MDPLSIISLLGLIPTLLADIPKIQLFIAEAVSNDSLAVKLAKLSPITVDFLNGAGSQLFPQVAPALHAAAAAMTIFDSADNKKWLQNALNLYVKPTPPLVVDGIIGKKTLAAMATAQDMLSEQFHVPLKTDSWAGMVSQGLLQSAVAQLSNAATPP